MITSPWWINDITDQWPVWKSKRLLSLSPVILSPKKFKSPTLRKDKRSFRVQLFPSICAMNIFSSKCDMSSSHVTFMEKSDVEFLLICWFDSELVSDPFSSAMFISIHWENILFCSLHLPDFSLSCKKKWNSWLI